MQKQIKQKYIQYPSVGIRDVADAFSGAIGRSKLAVTLLLGGIIIASLTEIATPYLYKRFFDAITAGGDKVLIAHEVLNILLIIFALNFINWVCYRVAEFSNAKFQTRGMLYLREKAFDYLIEHSYSFFSNNFTGGLVQRIGRFARAFERLADRLIWNVIPLFIRITGVIIVVSFFNRSLAYVIVGWVATFMVFNFFFSRWKLKYSIERAEADSRTTATMADAITNHNTIQLFSRERGESTRFSAVAKLQADITLFTWNLDGAINMFQTGLFIMLEFFLFYYTLIYWEQGLATIGTFVLLQTYVIGLNGRLWDFSRIVRDVYEGFADAKEMVEIMKLPHEITNVPAAKELRVAEGVVRFDKVSFTFNKNRQVLNDVTLTIAGGEKVALIGPSGAGKSTFVRLLLRLYDVGEGIISIDGQDIRSVTQKSLRQAISLVPQDPILFHRTLMENIRYGKPDATDAEVIEAARLAHCDEFIKSLPYKYETYVGERGIKLSGGERQRVAIARAILKNAPILILDEATSSLDSHSESLIQDALENLMRGKTTIVIAHRLSTIRKMDRIIVLDQGAILEEGSHDALLSAPGSLYGKLWTLQSGGFLKGSGEDEEAVVEEEE